MSISTWSSYRTKQDSPWQTFTFTKNALTVGNPNVAATQWYTAPNGSTTSPADTACDDTTDGADHLSLRNAATAMRVGALSVGHSQSAYNTWMLVDRLTQKFSLSGASILTQTVNTPALTRYTSGVGVIAMVEIAQQIGSVGTTFTCTYTNSDGTGGRTSPACPIGATLRRESGYVGFIPLQSGDVGVRSVQDLILALTTTQAGNFGIVLVAPLLIAPVHYNGQAIYVDPVLNAGILPRVHDDACLQWICFHGATTNTTGSFTAQLSMIAE